LETREGESYQRWRRGREKAAGTLTVANLSSGEGAGAGVGAVAVAVAGGRKMAGERKGPFERRLRCERSAPRFLDDGDHETS